MKTAALFVLAAALAPLALLAALGASRTHWSMLAGGAGLLLACMIVVRLMLGW